MTNAAAWLLKPGVKVAPLPLLATYAYVNPAAAVVIGHFLLGEPITTQTLIGGGIVILAVALIVASQSMGPNVKAPEPAIAGNVFRDKKGIPSRR